MDKVITEQQQHDLEACIDEWQRDLSFYRRDGKSALAELVEHWLCGLQMGLFKIGLYELAELAMDTKNFDTTKE